MYNLKVNYVKYYLTVTALLLLSVGFILFQLKPEPQLFITEKSYGQPPLKGHWLMTIKDEVVNESIYDQQLNKIETGLEIEKKNEIQIQPREELKYKVNDRHLNKKTNNINIMYLWTEKNKLKVLTIMTINEKTRKAGIITIPIYTLLKSDGMNVTIKNIYDDGGKAYLKEKLEKLLEVKIKNYLSIDQSALEKFSDIIGPFKLGGETLDMATAFAETSTGKRTDDQDVVRALGKHMIRPSSLIKTPRLLWFATKNIDSNMMARNFWHFVNVYKDLDYSTLRKIPLDGTDIDKNGYKYRYVADETWHNVIYDIVN